MRSNFPRPVLLACAWLAGVFALATAPLPAQGPKEKKKNLTLQVLATPSDPFSEFNTPNRAPGSKLTVRRGDTFLLTVSGTPAKGWHTYPITRRSPDQQDAGLSQLTISGTGVKAIWPITESEAEWKDYRKTLNEVILEHEKPFTWTQEVYVEPTAAVGDLPLTVKVRAQVCEDTCVWEDHTLTVPLTVASEAALAPSAELQKRLDVKAPVPIVVEPPASMRDKAPTKPNGETGKPTKPKDSSGTGTAKKASGFLTNIATAIGGGLISLLTPCVFPMIPITVSYFLKQSEVKPGAQSNKKPHNAVLMALVYSATIVLVMTLGGLLLMETLTKISTDYRTNFILGGIFIFFALSLLGAYDITLPSWLQDVTASREGSGGFLGVFFMALTFSIISFTCVGPIYGSFITLQASDASNVDRVEKYASVVAFSGAFAAPFFLLALFPSLMRTLPRAGSWMNSVKVVMGFLELAAAVKFLRAAEIALTSTSTLLTFDFSLGIYVAISLACGLYLLGFYRLPHDHGTPDTIGVPRLMFSLAFITLGLYLLPGLFKTADGDSQQPRGGVYAWVESFLLPDTDTKKPSGGGAKGGATASLYWHHKLSEALTTAEKEKKLVFVDFTGQQCTNCKLNERNAFREAPMQEAFKQHVLLKLYTDNVPPGLDQEPNAEESLELRNKVFESGSLPLYALIKPTGNGRYEILRKDEQGLIRDVPAFVEFLKP